MLYIHTYIHAHAVEQLQKNCLTPQNLAHTCTYTHTHTNTYIHTCSRPALKELSGTSESCTYIHTLVHTHTHTHTHTYIHTYTHAVEQLQKNCLAPQNLELKVSAQVMLLKNVDFQAYVLRMYTCVCVCEC